jgi:membrane protease YdiL (CAAX protease family)
MDLLVALTRMTAIWLWLLAASRLGPALGGDTALLLGHLGAVCFALGRPRREMAASRLSAFARGWLAGVVGYKGWQASIVVLGLAAGLQPAAVSQADPGFSALLRICVLAPVWEEALYRGRLLPALARRVGAPAAVALSSLAFALPHVQPWAVLGTFLFGCGLGSVERHSRRLGLCIGIHAGLNAAASFWGAAGAGPGVALASGLAFWALVLKGGRDDVR